MGRNRCSLASLQAHTVTVYRASVTSLRNAIRDDIISEASLTQNASTVIPPLFDKLNFKILIGGNDTGRLRTTAQLDVYIKAATGPFIDVGISIHNLFFDPNVDISYLDWSHFSNAPYATARPSGDPLF